MGKFSASINEMEMELLRVLDKQLTGCDRFTHHTSGTLTLLQCGHGVLQASSPTGVRLMADRDARAAYAHTPDQLPNEILRPGGTR